MSAPVAREDPAGFYAAGYSLPDAEQAARMGAWRELGARGKAAHVAALLRRRRAAPARVVEIGCGDGSLLAALAARGIGEELDGFELSAEAAEIARSRAIPGARRIEAFDGLHVPAEDRVYDLAVLSHVVEHVPDPVPLLVEAGRVAGLVLVEVPLEANRSAERPHKREEAERIGHLHAFDRAALRALCAAAGLRIVDELSDPLGREHLAFFADDAAARRRALAKTAVRRWAWRAAPLASERLFTVHCAVLAVPPAMR